MYCIRSIRKAPPLPRRGSCPASVCEQTGEGRSILRRKKGPPVGGGGIKGRRGIPLFLSFYCILKLHPNHIVNGFRDSFKKILICAAKTPQTGRFVRFCGVFAAPQLAAFSRQYLRNCLLLRHLLRHLLFKILRCHKNAAISHEVSCLRRFFASYK